jgi:prolyl-tRNA synthetase
MLLEKKYKEMLKEGGLFFAGPSKGSFILPPQGYALWKNIQNLLDKKFASRGVQNVLLPALIPLNLLEKEKEHISGFSPECFYVERIGEKKIESPLVLRPTSEVLFYEWYRQTLESYRDLPFLYNQWCSVFRAEKNTSPFFRNTEFFWQEGHTLHITSEEARQFTLDILADYRDYAENILNLAVIVGKKPEGEKFAGALETYTVECLLPDGQCLQFATSHYFGDNFCRLMKVDFQNKNNKMQYPFSTSWGTSTRAIGAIAKTHADNWGLILPFDIAPVQIAFVLIDESEELVNYYREIYSLLSPHYRCQLYNKSKQDYLNVLQADKEGCPFKIILGEDKELKNKEITLVRRDNIERRITISLKINEMEKNFLHNFENNLAENLEKYNLESRTGEQLTTDHEKMVNSVKNRLEGEKIIKVIKQEIAEFKKTIYQKSANFRDKHIFPVNNFSELEKKITESVKGLFLVPFCNKLECEEKIKKKIPAYSVRCVSVFSKLDLPRKCFVCEETTFFTAYVGRSY